MATVWHLYRTCMASVPHLYGNRSSGLRNRGRLFSCAVLVLAAPTSALAQNQVSAQPLQWMAWTWQTGVFFAIIATLLVAMTVWELSRPGGDPRSPGMLGINTTRGDRLFISLLSAAFIHLGWLGLVTGPLWGATLISLIWMLAVFRWV